MALHPGSLTSAYASLQEGGFSAGTMRNACEQAHYRGSFTLGRYTVTFGPEDGYRVYCRELASVPAAECGNCGDPGPEGTDCGNCGDPLTAYDERMAELQSRAYADQHARDTAWMAQPERAAYEAQLASLTGRTEHVITLTPLAARNLAATLTSSVPCALAAGPLFVTVAADRSVTLTMVT